jgi:hypothetical protein
VSSRFNKRIAQLEKEVRDLDDFAGGVDPNEFVTQPQRFPHADGADLGDNYIGLQYSDKHGDYPGAVSDRLVLPSQAQQRLPEELSTFFGDAQRERRPMYARRHLKDKDIRRLRNKPRLLKYANDNFQFGKNSPLKKKYRRLVNGLSDRYMDDKFGFPADVYPSTKQYRSQVSPPVTPSRLAAMAARRRDPWESPKLKQRWRKTDPDCRGPLCVWKPLLEAADKECEKEDCSDACKGDECGEAKDPVEVCGGLGCEEATPSSEAADPLAKQLSEGALDGHADPFGFADALDDKQEPAEGAALDLGLRSHFRTNGGEPVGDSVVRGWDMHNGGALCLYLACGPWCLPRCYASLLEGGHVVDQGGAYGGRVAGSATCEGLVAAGWLQQACARQETALWRNDVHAGHSCAQLTTRPSGIATASTTNSDGEHDESCPPRVASRYCILY